MPWKPVDIPLSFLSSGEAEFIGLEELDDYTEDDIIKLDQPEKPKEKTAKKPKGKKTASKRKAQSDEDSGHSSDNDSSMDEVDDDNSSTEKAKEKRSTSKHSEVKDKKKVSKKIKEPTSRRFISLSDIVDVNEESANAANESPQGNEAEEKSKPKKPRNSLKKVAVTDAADEGKITKAMSHWSGMDIPTEILHALYDNKFFKPTEIQKQAIPAALAEHRDVIGAAETGSGKTLAYGLPLISHIFAKLQQEATTSNEGSDKEKEEPNIQRPLGLVLVPTRELAVQVKQHLDSAAAHCAGITTGLIVGGLSSEKQQRILNLRPPILVATPGRLWQMVRDRTSGLDQISSIRYLVVDEADRIVEKAHFAELKLLIQHINNNQPERQKRQTLLFSATLTFAQYDVKSQTTAPAVLQEKLRHLMESLCMKNRPKIIDLSPAGTTTRSLVEAKVICEGGDVEKDAVLYAILSQYPGRTLVFANAISTVRKISNTLRLLFSPPAIGKNKKRNAAPSRPILALHAQLRQRVRLKYLDRFRDEGNAILVASDVAARGLDIPNIEHVIHYHVPNSTESYVHRSGRTARLAAEGLSILLVDPKVEAGRFWRLMANLCRRATTEEAKAADVADFEIDSTLLAQCRERINVCRELESLKHQEKKIAADKKWLTEGCSDFENSSSEASSDDGEPSARSATNKMSNEVRQLEMRLAQLKAVSLKVRSNMTMSKYPTQMGQAMSADAVDNLLHPTAKKQDSAIEHMANSRAKGGLAKSIVTAAKIERRKLKRQQEAEAKREDKIKRKNQKRDLKRKKRDEQAESSQGNKDFVFY